MRRVVGGLALVALAALIATFVWPTTPKSSMARIDAVLEALEKDDPAAIAAAIDGYPACADATPVALLPSQTPARDIGCFAGIANALGSQKGFNARPPDQSAATTVAIVVLRDGRGDWVAHSEELLTTIKAGRGDGTDALRLAVARKMAEVAPRVGRSIQEEKDALDAMKAIASAIPGACPTYWLLGSGTDPSKIAAENSANDAACVSKDLGRREGPGSSYGAGTFRALEGSLAFWRETERALRLGLATTRPSAKAVIGKKLEVIEAATQAIATKKMESTTKNSTVMFLGEVHAEAGIVLWKDAGADAAADAAKP